MIEGLGLDDAAPTMPRLGPGIGKEHGDPREGGLGQRLQEVAAVALEDPDVAQAGRVDPGDTVGLSCGVGYALNDRTSISMSYEHNFISGTTTESNGVDVEGQSFDIGSLNLGSSLRLNDRMRLNLGLRAGLTEDAPDVAVTARLPIIFDLF